MIQPMHLLSPRRRTIRNGVHAIAEYASQPLGLLLSAPFLLRHMGASQFGIWVLASAMVNSGNTVASGFGDTAVKYVAMYRGRNEPLGVARVVRGMIYINLALSAVLAIAVWILAPFAAAHVPHLAPALLGGCIKSFRIGGLLVVIRSLDGVFVSTLRAFERYAPAVLITICSRIGSLVAAIVLVARGFGVVEVMWATLAIAAVAVVAQGIAVRAVAGRILLLPSLHSETLHLIANFGGFSWLQALSAAIFGQVDRFVIGAFLGTPAVAAYALCAQAAQVIHCIVSAGFHALFPHLSSRVDTEPLAGLKPLIFAAFKFNLALSVLLSAPIVLFSHPILKLWMGPAFADRYWLTFAILGSSFGLFALNVTAHYTLLSIGRIRLVTAINILSGAAMLLLMLPLTPRFGMVGTACARLVCGPITCLLYYPLYRMLREVPTAVTATATPAWENS